MTASVSPQTPSANEPSCPLCNRSGLPILPVRYAVARADKGVVPDIAKPFEATGVKLPDGIAKYALRTLRAGFLYMFDEVRGEWTAYVITEQGYLYEFDYHANVAPQVPNKSFNEACWKKGDPYIARCVFVKDAAKAGNIWLGFSDAVWTDQVRENHQKADYRRKHMRRIDMAAVRAGAVSKKAITHVNSLRYVRQVADFTRGLRPASAYGKEGASGVNLTMESFSAMAFSEQPVHALENRAHELIDWGSRSAKPYEPLMAALDDPAGIAGDLAMLMLARTEEFVHDESVDRDRARKVALSAAISNLRESVETQAEQDFIADNERAANFTEARRGGYIAPNGVWIATDDAEIDRKAAGIRAKATPQTIKAARNDAWKKYADMYSEPNRKDWQGAFDTAFKEFDQQVTGPLAVAHRDTMKHEQTANYFQCNFCTKTPASGAMYAAVLGNSIKGTQDKVACVELYTIWLEGSTEDRNNLLLRGLSLNNDFLASQVQAATAFSVTWQQMSWDKVMGIGKDVLEKLTEGELGGMNRLAAAVSGPTTVLMKRTLTNSKVSAGIVSQAVLAQAPFVQVTLTGSKRKFYELLVRSILRMNEQTRSLPENKLRQAVANELRRLEAMGVDMTGSTKNWQLLLDPAHMKSMPPNLSMDERVKWAIKSIHTPEQVEALEIHRYEDILKARGERIKRAVPSGPFILALLALGANAVALGSIQDDQATGLNKHDQEMQRRVLAQKVYVVGATADAIEAGLARLAVRGMRLGAAGGMVRTAVGGIGKAFGLVGGLAFAVLDGMRAVEEYKAGHAGAAWAYGVSAAIGFAASVLLFIGWTGWGLFVVGLIFLWSFVMTKLVNNKIQDWLEQCYWGKDAIRFGSSEQEMQQLKMAVGA